MIMPALPVPTVEGVFGPEVLLNTETGVGCFLDDEGVPSGALPGPPSTNAFLVWVGRAVLVVSDGVREEHRSVVAHTLRQRLHAAQLPIVFSQRAHAADGGTSIAVDAAGVQASELARAEAYALVQLAWEEDVITVRVAGDVHRFEVSFVETQQSNYRPVVRPA
jgi:hypothetical protein